MLTHRTVLRRTRNAGKRNALPALAFQKSVAGLFIHEVVVEIVNRLEIEINVVAFNGTYLGGITHELNFLQQKFHDFYPKKSIPSRGNTKSLNIL